MKTRKNSILISACITFIATILITIFCVNDWSGITPLAFSMILWSELVFFGGLIIIEKVSDTTEQIISRSTLSTLFSSYFIVNVIFSIVCIVLFKESITTFAVIEILLFAILAIGIVASLAISKGVYNSNTKTMNSVESVEGLINRLNKLAVLPECESYSAILKKSSDDLRFTDISVIVSEDKEIDEVISSIEIAVANKDKLDDEQINSKMISLNSLIERRKISTSQCKKGNI